MPTTTRFMLLTGVLLASQWPLPGTSCRAEDDGPLMTWNMVQDLTRKHLESLPPQPYADLVVWEDLQPLFDEIVQRGWALPYREEISKRMVKQGEFLAQFARSEPGARYLNSCSQELLLDRIDRMSRARGGQRALQDLVRLPNATSISPTPTKSFMPSLTDMLPKSGGKAPRIKDYDKPTHRTYSKEQVLQVMQSFHKIEEARRAREGEGNGLNPSVQQRLLDPTQGLRRP